MTIPTVRRALRRERLPRIVASVSAGTVTATDGHLLVGDPATLNSRRDDYLARRNVPSRTLEHSDGTPGYGVSVRTREATHSVTVEYDERGPARLVVDLTPQR